MAEKFKPVQDERNPLTSEQLRTHQYLRDIMAGTQGNPLTQLGAQLMVEEDKQVHYWDTPLNALGLTFGDKYLAEDASSAETNALKEAGLSPISARNQVAADKRALEFKRTDIIPHEISHLAANFLKFLRPNTEEVVIREMMLREGLAVGENQEYLDRVRALNPNLNDVIDAAIKDLNAQATKELAKRKKK